MIGKEYRQHIRAYPNVIDNDWPQPECKRVIDAVFDEVPGRSTVLEVGCNSGWLLQRLRDEKNCNVVGVEPAAKPLAAAKQRLNGCVVDAFGEDLPFADGSFDVTIGCTLLQQVTDVEPVMREMSRVTKTQGSLLGVNPTMDGGWGETALGKNPYVISTIPPKWFSLAYPLSEVRSISEHNYLWKTLPQAGRPPLAVVIPVHRCLKYTKQAIRSFVYPGPYELIVIDNANDWETRQYLDDCQRPARYLPQTENLGAARSWNLGIRTALDSGYDYILVMNNDIVLSPEAPRRLVSTAKYDGGFVTACSIGDQLDELLTWPRTNTTGIPDFCCFMVTREIWDAIGPFDERYWPAYVEDRDYDNRLAAAGIPRYATMDALVAHYGSRTRLEGGVNTKIYKKNNQRIFAQTYGYWPNGEPYVERKI